MALVGNVAFYPKRKRAEKPSPDVAKPRVLESECNAET